jgi:hypothetical protein
MMNNTHVVKALVFALALVTSSTASALADAAPQAPQAQRDGQHDFDFNVGTWTSHIRKLLHPLSGSTTWVEYRGNVLVRKVWDGRANLEEVEADGSAGHMEFVELRMYNRDSHQWSINAARPSDGFVQGPPLIGDFDSGRGLFYDQEFWNGKAIFVRQIWTVIGPTSYSMEQSFSQDGGATWEINFIANVTRAQ